MKKVLFTSHTANFSKFNRPFMRWFKDQGYEVHYASAGEEEVLDCDRHFIIPFERSPFKPNNLKAIRQLKKIIDTEKYDIIHTHTPMGSVVTRLAAIDARKNGTRVIYTAHGFHFFKGAPLKNWLIYYPIEKIMAYFTDILITINNEDYQRAKKKLRTHVEYVPGVGIDEEKFNFEMTEEDKKKLRESLNIKETDFVMIYPAELSKRKRQLWLINTLKELLLFHNDIHLILPGKDSLSGACQQVTRDLMLEKQIHFLGYRNDICQLMIASDISVSSSFQEGLPVNIMEAMAAKRPVVSIKCRGCEDLIVNGSNGYLVNKNDSFDFVDRIKTLYDESAKRDQIGAAYEPILKRYLLKNILPIMANIYRRILKA